ncbi:MAG: type VI secretion system membrane subunit TssM [Acidobacteria bacterium]|nr:type VI secretion system membrane subunit TssM [Acidobacteriota bacterium]
MSWHASQMKFALGLGGMMSFYGAVSLVILLMPPGSFGGRQYQVAVIALVLLTLPFALIIMFVASRRAKKKAKKEAEAAEKAAEAASPATPAAPSASNVPVGSFANLTSGTEEAVQFLKTSNLGSSGRDAVYSLPWYIVAGAPRAGKSSLVLSSNLNFQTLPSQRQSEQKFIRPTGSVDWRVTSDAVFVDTAGRYQTEGVDAEEWASLLETIKKYRGNRPVDGFLLVVDAETVLKSDERQLEELAKVLRARLDDTLQRLKVRFPVYVVFTHADTIEGFRDSFSSSKNEDKTLVWGATIPIEKSENAQALFDGEYEVLHNSLMKRRIVRLSAPFPAVRQLRIFNFPLHFGSARRKFGTFINALFRPNPFSENPFLRGFYFTASPVGKSNGNAAMVGNPYFTERFFRDVVLRDKDLVKTFIDSRQRAPIFGWMLTILGAILVFALLVMAGISLASNSQLLQDASTRGQSLIQMVKADAGKNPLEKKDQAVRDELNQTENMRQLLTRLDDYDRNGPPLYMRFGLYSGTKIYKENLLPVYLSVVEQRFKEPAVKKLEADLAKFAASKPVANPSKLTDDEEKLLEKNLNLLKAYLMLSGEYKAQAQSGHVANMLKEYWLSESKTPGDMKPIAEQQLEFWAKQIDREDVGFPRIQLNPKLVADARMKLKDFPAEYRYLSRKVTEISKQVNDTIGQTTVDAILTRSGSDSSFMTGTYAVPSAYTRPGLDLMKEAIANADEEMKKDDWVMGDAGKGDVAAPSKMAQIEDRYYRDYAMHWTQFVQSTDVKAYKNRNEAASAIQAFSQPNSPMKILMREIAKNTNLSAEPESDGWIDWIKRKIFSKKAAQVGSSEPEKLFRPLFMFVGTKEQGENAPIEKYTGEMGKMFKSFNAVSESGMKKVAEEMAADKDPLEINKRQTAVSNFTASFNESSSGQQLATLLMQPLTRLKSLLGAGAKEQLAKTWAEQLLPAAKEIEKGYPFEDGATEADLKNVTAYLAPNEGRLSKFYEEKLSNYFEESNGQYKVKEGSDLQFSDEFVAYLNNAFALQKALYGKSATPKFEYEFTFKPMKDTLIEITIDGQKTTSEGTGSLKGTFPGANASEVGVIMKLASTAGTASSSDAPPSSANSSNSSVSPPSGSPSGGSSGELVFQGQWGLFRFVDRGSPEKQPGGEYLLKYTVGGKPVTATIKSSGGDLFNKNMFRQAKAPQNFLK